MHPRLSPDGYFGETQDRRLVAGLTITRTVHRLPARLPVHTHEAPYFCLVMSGAFDETVDRKLREARPGTLLFHPPGESHTNEIRSEQTRLFNIALDRSWVRRMEGIEPRSGPRPGRQNAAAARIARRIAGETSVRDRTSALAIEGLALALIAAVAPSPDSVRGGPPTWMPVALDFIRSSFLSGFEYEALARVAGVHPTHLARAFHRHTGRTVTAYVHQLRIEWARQRLAREDTAIVEIALDAGFADHAHFTRVFRRETRTTPSEYRRRLRSGRV
jgi:AraC family transcriptional regulator